MKNITPLFVLLFILFSCSKEKKEQQQHSVVKTIQDFQEAVKTAQPGDSILLAKGIWKDAELLFEAKGTPEKPITLTVEEKGKTTLEGASYLRMAGEHLVVSGLVFQNGFTPTSEVISLKKTKRILLLTQDLQNVS